MSKARNQNRANGIPYENQFLESKFTKRVKTAANRAKYIKQATGLLNERKSTKPLA